MVVVNSTAWAMAEAGLKTGLATGLTALAVETGFLLIAGKYWTGAYTSTIVVGDAQFQVTLNAAQLLNLFSLLGFGNGFAIGANAGKSERAEEEQRERGDTPPAGRVTSQHIDPPIDPSPVSFTNGIWVNEGVFSGLPYYGPVSDSLTPPPQGHVTITECTHQPC